MPDGIWIVCCCGRSFRYNSCISDNSSGAGCGDQDLIWCSAWLLAVSNEVVVIAPESYVFSIVVYNGSVLLTIVADAPAVVMVNGTCGGS